MWIGCFSLHHLGKERSDIEVIQNGQQGQIPIGRVHFYCSSPHNGTLYMTRNGVWVQAPWQLVLTGNYPTWNIPHPVGPAPNIVAHWNLPHGLNLLPLHDLSQYTLSLPAGHRFKYVSRRTARTTLNNTIDMYCQIQTAMTM